MRYRPCLATCLAIAACDGAGPEGNRSAGAAAPALRAGEWEMEFGSYTLFPAPKPNDAPVINFFTHSKRACIRSAPARPEPAVFFEEGSVCRYDRFAIGGGTIDAVLACEAPWGLGGRYTVTLRGRYEAERFDVTPRRKGPFHALHWHTKGRRVGECASPGRR